MKIQVLLLTIFTLLLLFGCSDSADSAEEKYSSQIHKQKSQKKQTAFEKYKEQSQQEYENFKSSSDQELEDFKSN